MRRIGILGGSFNPVHRDHLSLGQYVASALDLDEILLIPNASPPHKSTCAVPFAHRLNMLRAACGNQGLFRISEIEADGSRPHYSLDTLRTLRARLPEAALFFIMGLDSLLSLDEWHEGLRLTDYANLAVMCRRGYERARPKPAVAAFMERRAVYERQGEAFAAAASEPDGHCLMLGASLSVCSSSEIRHALARYYRTRDPLCLSGARDQLPDGVLDYILENGLYQND